MSIQGEEPIKEFVGLAMTASWLRSLRLTAKRNLK